MSMLDIEHHPTPQEADDIMVTVTGANGTKFHCPLGALIAIEDLAQQPVEGVAALVVARDGR